MKWVTREHVHVDRVACPWLIKRFIDPEAEFIFVPRDTDPSTITEGIPFDFKGVKLGHHDGKCSFDAFIEKYNITDPAVLKIAEIVREADTHVENPQPLSVALDILARGYRMICRDDYETLEKEFYLYDAMYAHFKKQIEEGKA
ncbi:chromate resistance protein ChrB domain-containing protein [Thermococcus sp. ES12]|uniref:chromate resistance protein ChrB domain-containing protein n=1 Tax=Thermococcus sp. ES12 TaxID=1638246 RepID=UPI00142FA25E|nr:chromate resistance protein ChrB domain-containing protein [Thermococcus sp. ES12]NJE76868.1 chromate resistance protein [Thermococcus sp. ES12]